MRRPCDGHCEESGVSGPLGPAKRRMAVGHRFGNLCADHPVESSVRQDLRRPRVVGLRFGQGIVQKRDRRWLMGSMRACKLEEDIGPLHTLRNLPEEPFEHRHRPLSLPGEAVEARAPNPAPTSQARVVRRQLGGQLAELRSSGGRAACRCLLRGRVELGGGDGVRPLDRERHVARPLLEIGDRLGEGSVNRAPLPGLCLLVADRCEQRVREPKARVVERDDPFPLRRVESLENVGPVAVGGRDQLDGRAGERGGEEHDVAGLGRAAAPGGRRAARAGSRARGARARPRVSCPSGRARARARARRTDCRPTPPAPGRAPAGSARARARSFSRR